MEEQPSLVRRHIAAGSTTSGWGLYAAQVLREMEPDPDPVSQLAERVLALRDAHLAVADLGMHTRQLTAAAAVSYLTTHLPLERDTALADVRRLASRPTSAAAAILGRTELLRLRGGGGPSASIGPASGALSRSGTEMRRGMRAPAAGVSCRVCMPRSATARSACRSASTRSAS